MKQTDRDKMHDFGLFIILVGSTIESTYLLHYKNTRVNQKKLLTISKSTFLTCLCTLQCVFKYHQFQVF